jgi:GntR family transcriptional repressor for pyruvate dehydrogenase complex
MARQSLVGMISDDILNRIVSGEFPSGATLPGELEFTVQHDVSRLTVREAMKTLEAQGIVRVERGRGTFVNEISRWASMDAVLRATTEGRDDGESSIQLIEVRRMLETGAAELAASRITADELLTLEHHVATMESAHADADLGRFVQADLAFHDVILHCSGNVFLAVMFDPLSRTLAARRAQTSRIPEIQVHAIREHHGIVVALRSGDAERSRQAMDSHMTQTMDDLKKYVLEA